MSRLCASLTSAYLPLSFRVVALVRGYHFSLGVGTESVSTLTRGLTRPHTRGRSRNTRKTPGHVSDAREAELAAAKQIGVSRERRSDGRHAALLSSPPIGRGARHSWRSADPSYAHEHEPVHTRLHCGRQRTSAAASGRRPHGKYVRDARVNRPRRTPRSRAFPTSTVSRFGASNFLPRIHRAITCSNYPMSHRVLLYTYRDCFLRSIVTLIRLFFSAKIA